jgi:hypothetical protein
MKQQQSREQILGVELPERDQHGGTDGQTAKENPALASQFEIDKTVCEGDMQKANLSGTTFCQGVGCVGASIDRGNAMQTVGKGCMAQRGYVQVPEEQAAAKSAEFAALRRNPPPQTTALQGR